MTTHGIPDGADVLLRPGPRLVLSPHLDDALLSAFSIASAEHTEVWTVFAGRPNPAQSTSWDRSCGFADSDATLSARWAEDTAAFDGLPATVRRFQALEGAYASPKRREADLRELTFEIEQWIDAHPGGTVFIPAGAGKHVPEAPWTRARQTLTSMRQTAPRNKPSRPQPIEAQATKPTDTSTAEVSSSPRGPGHRAARGILVELKKPAQRILHWEYRRRRRRATGADSLAANPDHIALRDLVLAHWSGRPGVNIVLYEELPYLWHERADNEVERLARRFQFAASVTSAPVDRHIKHSHLKHYVSQMPVMDAAGRLLSAATLPPLERYWLVSATELSQ